jgi:twitching motility protein PilT
VRGKIERTDGPVLSPDQIRSIALAAVGEQRLEKMAAESGRLVVSCALPGVISGQMCVASSRSDYTITVRLIGCRIMSPQDLAVPEAFVQAAKARNGLLLFTGIPGSGKTTTVFSILEQINRQEARHICTVEDPIGAVLTPKQSLIQQREIGVDVPDGLAGIAAAMRQDADVLFIGQLKTVEEVQAVLTAAQMQYLVLTQLETARTPQMAVQRLLEIQPSDQLATFRRRLAAVLQGAIGQVLLPRLDGRGLVAAYGVLIPDEGMRRAIADGRDPFACGQPLPAGCQSLVDHIERLRRERVVSEAVAQDALQQVRTAG